MQNAMPARSDVVYRRLLLAPLAECARYRPAFGQEGEEGVDLPQFRTLYGSDPLYHWIGLDSDLMYAAHKAAGGMTSIYRQLGVGCERLLRAVIQDCLSLSESDVAWSYQYDKGNGGMAVHKLDARILAEHIQDRNARRRVLDWVYASARRLGLPEARASAFVGAVFEIRQGYKSADSKRQGADIRFGIRARDDANLLPVIAIVSTQASDVVCRRYSDNHLLVLRGTLAGQDSTFEFYRSVVNYDLAAFFQRNTDEIRAAFQEIIARLLTA